MLNIKKRKIKDKGIALCHESQGFSANKRPISLLMKSDIKPEDLTEDIIKNLQQVTVTMSMEEFLQKFFGLWYSDAELLAKLLGFETELENKMSQGDMEDDVWEQAWAEAHQEWLEDKMESFVILKSAVLGDELSLPQKYELIKVQQSFEKAMSENNIVIEISDLDKKTGESETVEKVKPKTKTVKVDSVDMDELKNKKPGQVEEKDTNKSQQEKNVTDVVDVTKSAEYTALQAKLAEIEKASQEKDELVKAAQAVIADKEKQELVSKAASFSFVTDEDKEVVANVLMKAKENKSLEDFMSVIEKANTKIVDLEKQLADKDQELNDVKKEFGEKEHGTDQKPVVVSERQQFIEQQAALLKAAKEKENK